MAVDIVLNPVALLDDGSSNVYINYLTMELGTFGEGLSREAPYHPPQLQC